MVRGERIRFASKSGTSQLVDVGGVNTRPVRDTTQIPDRRSTHQAQRRPSNRVSFTFSLSGSAELEVGSSNSTEKLSRPHFPSRGSASHRGETCEIRICVGGGRRRAGLAFDPNDVSQP